MPWRAPLFFICFQSRLPRLGGLRPLFEQIFLKRERKRMVFGWSLRSAVPLLLVRHFSYSWDFTAMRRRQWLLLLRLQLQDLIEKVAFTITSATEGRHAHHDLNGATKV